MSADQNQEREIAALRQYRHNFDDDIVFGYDMAIIDRLLLDQRTELERLRSQLSLASNRLQWLAMQERDNQQRYTETVEWSEEARTAAQRGTQL